MAPDLRAIALGAGVQSTTLYLLAATGAIQPTADVAIFADTQSEPPWVYQHLDWLQREFGHLIPIHRTTYGSLERDCLESREGRKRWAAIPFFTRTPTGSPTGYRRGRLRRQCTREYKIDPIKRALRELVGFGRVRVEEWIGISIDEAHRAKPSRYGWITSRWPLLDDVPMTRGACIEWLRGHGFPVPRKSACYFCPFHDDATWAGLKRDAPEVFARAVWFDREIRHGTLRGETAPAYLHSSLVPLDEVCFRGDSNGDQLELTFGNECEGMCGV